MEATPEEEFDPGILYEWDFGTGAVPATISGIGPHTIHYTTSGAKVITCTATYQSIQTVDTFNLTVVACPGSITGKVVNLLGVGLPGYNQRLYEDFDQDGLPDGPAVRDSFSGASGQVAMTNLPIVVYDVGVGQYILEANYTLAEAISMIDTNIGGNDGIVDLLPIVPGITDPSNFAVRIPVRPQKVNGVIEIKVNI